MQKKKIITEEYKRIFKKLWDQKGVADPVIVFGFCLPYMEYSFYVVAYDPKENVVYWYDNIQWYKYYTLEALEEIWYAWDPFERIDFIKGTKLSRQVSNFYGSWDDIRSDDEDDSIRSNENFNTDFSYLAKKLFD